MIAHTSSAAIRSGPPQRGASRKRSATVPRTPAPESHRARQALTVLRQIPSLSAVPSIPRPSPKSNTMRARIASCCGVKDARIRRSSPSRSSSLNSILAALRPISSLHREIIATENQTTENKSLICESELTPTCTRAFSDHSGSYPELTKKFAHSVGVNSSMISAMAAQRSSTVRAAAFLSNALSFEKACSMGLKSGE